MGRPNCGKSSLINAMTGEKVSIVSPRPQTTKDAVTGIFTKEDGSAQLVMTDTPGIFKPRKEDDIGLGKAVRSAAGGADVIVYVIDGTHKLDERDENNISVYARRGLPIILVINKVDLCAYEQVYPIIAHYNGKKGITEIIPVSAKAGTNVDKLKEIIIGLLPEGEAVYGDDEYTTSPEKFMAAEILREKMLYLLREEVPHGVSVEVTEYKKRKGRALYDIGADIVCDKDNHKTIIIGKGGAMLKEIGKRARPDIEKLTGCPVNLQLFVKVRK